jgi:hypothetical protein
MMATGDHVFIVPFHVRSLENSIMPPGTSEAYVSCYALAPAYEEAVLKCLGRLREDGLEPAEILQPIYSMDVSAWSQHVSEQWPDYASSLPSQSEFEGSVTRGGVVYGPFGSY